MSAAGNPLSSAATSTEAPPPDTTKKPVDFSADWVPSSDQRSYCLEALKAFKEKKSHSPEKIASEFSSLQFSCQKGIDILYYPCTFSRVSTGVEPPLGKGVNILESTIRAQIEPKLFFASHLTWYGSSGVSPCVVLQLGHVFLFYNCGVPASLRAPRLNLRDTCHLSTKARTDGKKTPSVCLC
ncbi:hypothetical protein FXO37_30498 [Capsicum annuum]|nr:hypothetical protein FXO37_30498 [Capsicum annuum]